MIKSTIYSIGHGNKKTKEFINELKSFNIQYLIDIRSKPFSKWNPQFNKSSIESILHNNQIAYIFAGDTLGGLPDDSSCYDYEGKVVYDLIKEKDFFKNGLERLKTASQKQPRVAIMCSESNPEECHRSKLIGQELLKNDISIQHIVATNRVKNQQTVMNELTKGKGTIDLFGNEPELTSRKTY